MAADGEIDAAFVVPTGFGDAVQAGGSAEIRVIGDVDEPTAPRSPAPSRTASPRTERGAALRRDRGGGDPGSLPPDEPTR